jgi:CBS domain-containing protein
MLSQPLRGLMARDKMVTATPQATVLEVAGLMLAHGTGAVMVVEDGALVGILSERDVVVRVVAPGRDARTVQVGEVMTPHPVSVDPDVTFGHALLLMHEHGIRHLPVVENGKPIGMVTARVALDPELEEFVCEVRRRETFR